MKQSISLITVIAAMAVVSCSLPEQELTSIFQEGQPVQFSAYNGEDAPSTKTLLIQDGYLDNGQPQMITWWNAHDEIGIFYGASSVNRFVSNNTEPVKKAVFEGTLNAFTGQTETGDFNYFWAVYPYDSAVSCDGSSVTAVLADEQEALSSSYANNTNITIAKSPGLSLSFYNVCSFFRFNVEKQGIIAVTFRGNNNEAIAGKFSVSIGSDGKPTDPVIIDAEKEITLSRPNNEPFVVGDDYYFVLLPQTFENGFTVRFDTSTEFGDRVISTSATFARNSINYGVAAFDRGVEYSNNNIPPENEIWYTTSDGSMLNINENLGWFRNISTFENNHVVYHKYKRGKGIVRFDGPVNHIPQNAFKDYVKMTSVKLPANVETIQAYAFSGTSISRFECPQSLTYIGNMAFQDVQTMTWLQLNSSVITVGRRAFRNNGITSAIVYAQELEDYVFEGSKLKTLRIGSSCSKIGTSIVSGCTNLETIEVIGNQSFTSDCVKNSQSSEMNCIMRRSDNMVLAGCKKTIFSALNNYTSYSINAEAFKNVGLNEWVDLSQVISIGANSFWGNNIQFLSIGYSNRNIVIDDCAFGSNPYLESVNFDSLCVPVVGYNIFQNCGNEFTIYVPSSRLSYYQNATNLSQYASQMIGQ